MTDAPDNRVARQERITTHPLPASTVEFLCHLEGRIAAIDATVNLSYVPYKNILAAETFADYLTELPVPDDTASALETSAAVILDDLNNELVPRWLQLVLTRHRADGTVQRVLVEDKQPRWNNKVLLSRAKGL